MPPDAPQASPPVELTCVQELSSAVWNAASSSDAGLVGRPAVCGTARPPALRRPGAASPGGVSIGAGSGESAVPESEGISSRLAVMAGGEAVGMEVCRA